jgi:hypothetical protein
VAGPMTSAAKSGLALSRDLLIFLAAIVLPLQIPRISVTLGTVRGRKSGW